MEFTSCSSFLTYPFVIPITCARRQQQYHLFYIRRYTYNVPPNRAFQHSDKGQPAPSSPKWSLYSLSCPYPGGKSLYDTCVAASTRHLRIDGLLELRKNKWTQTPQLSDCRTIPSPYMPAFNYHNHHFCRLLLGSIWAAIIGTYKSDGYGSQRWAMMGLTGIKPRSLEPLMRPLTTLKFPHLLCGSCFLYLLLLQCHRLCCWDRRQPCQILYVLTSCCCP